MEKIGDEVVVQLCGKLGTHLVRNHDQGEAREKEETTRGKGQVETKIARENCTTRAFHQTANDRLLRPPGWGALQWRTRHDFGS